MNQSETLFGRNKNTLQNHILKIHIVQQLHARAIGKILKHPLLYCGTVL